MSVTLFSCFTMATRKLQMKSVVQFSKSSSSNFMIVIQIKVRTSYRAPKISMEVPGHLSYGEPEDSRGSNIVALCAERK